MSGGAQARRAPSTPPDRGAPDRFDPTQPGTADLQVGTVALPQFIVLGASNRVNDARFGLHLCSGDARVRVAAAASVLSRALVSWPRNSPAIGRHAAGPARGRGYHRDAPP